MKFLILRKLKNAIASLVVNNFLKIINKIIFFPCDFLCQRLNLYIVFLREERIGHQAGNTDVEFYKANERKKRKNSKTIFIFPFPENKVANKYLRYKLIDYVNLNFYKAIVKNDQYLNNSFSNLIIYLLPKIFKSCKNIYFANTDIGKRLKYPIIKTSKTHENLCKEIGIDSKKYICITSRDNKYLNERYKNANWNYHNYRNSDIDNLKELSQYVSKEMGMTVVRIGSNPEKKIYWSSKKYAKIIDYSYSGFQSPKNDIELISGCNLFINNGGGVVAAALAAKREIITINHIPTRISPGYIWGLWIPKLIKKKNEKEILSLRQIEELNLATAINTKDYINAGVETIENNGEDIFNAFKDYFRIKNGLINEKEKKVINRYIEMRNKTKHLFYNGAINDDLDIIAPSFLLKYPELLY